jgi:subtilisin
MTFRCAANAQRFVSLSLVAITLLVLVLPGLPLTDTFAQDSMSPPSGDVIVVLKTDAPAGSVTAAANGAAVEPNQVFTNVFDGFSATISPEEAQALAESPLVEAVYPDTTFRVAEQTLPSGVDRIGADENPSVDIDGIDDVRVHTDVAVLDTGIASDTAELKLMGGTNCLNQSTGSYLDDNGHGTHVAGTIGALDNGRGVVGVAPGARLWSVKVLDRFGNGSMASLICGLDWVYANRAVIDIVNMSIEGGGADGSCDNSAFHMAICTVVNEAGIPVIVAAGNHATDASRTIPATYNEVITVSSVDDFDGQPGGLSSSPRCGSNHADDALAATSNFGPDVDIAAPGVCIESLAPGGGTAIKSGTSMAAPHVTGAAAIYLDMNRSAAPANVRTWLLGNASPQSSEEGFTGDRDSQPEPLVWLGGGEAVVTAPYKLVASDASVNSAASKYVRDRNLNTVWKTKRFRSGPPAEAWVWVDLGERKLIGNIRWVFGEYGIGDYFEIEGSNDRQSWSRITKRNGKPVGVWQEKVTSQTYRYVRFRFENPRNDLYLGGLAEVQIWPPNTAPPLPGATSTPTPTRTATPTPTIPPNGNYPMYGSSRSGNSTSPTAVWDGDLDTIWQTDGESVPSAAHVYVTIGSILPIGTIRWVYGAEGIGDSVTIRVSNDHHIWTDVHTAGNAPVGEWQSVDFTDLNAKYVGWFFENPNQDPVIGGLAEVEIYPPGAFDGEERTATPTTEATGQASPIPVETSEPASPEPVVTETQPPTATEAPASPEPIASETPIATGTATEPVNDPATPADQDAISTPELTPTSTDDAATETPMVELSGPTPYPIVQTRRSAATTSGTLAIDADPETVWRSAPDADPTRIAVLTLDLGQAVEIGQVRILSGPDGLMGAATIETSTDDEAWVYYAEPDPAMADEDGWLQIDQAEPTSAPLVAQYVRVVFIAASEGAPLGGIAEIEILPPAESDSP